MEKFLKILPNHWFLTLSNFDLKILNSISPSKLGGIIDGFVEVKGLYGEFALQNNVTIKNLEVDKFLVGDVTGTTLWDREIKQFLIDFYIDRLNTRTLNLTGTYNPSDKKSPLFVNATLAETNLKIIEPFLKGIFSKIDGSLTGRYEITGTFAQPLIQGEGKIARGQIMIDYLKTLYTFDGTLAMTPTKIIFNDFTLYDGLKNKGVLDGYLTHRNYSRFRINLDASFNTFQLLNTTSKDNSLFYGQAYGSGNLNMLGPLNNMKISATARTSKNTRVFIPISGSESVEKSEFINFVHFRDTVQIAEKKQVNNTSSEPSGIILDLNLDITPDAYTEIIFDIKAGDIIRGYGRGDIKLQIDTKGEFNMFGLYEFEQGYYNFTLFDIINKEFAITKGSRLSWFGDPYSGVLDLKASYKQMASIGPILPDQSEATQASAQVRRKYPVEVLLKLDGPMLSPQIAFDIDAKNLPDNVTADNGSNVQLNFAFKAFKAKLDEQELQRQVFSIIILRRFSPLDAFSTSGSISNSVSELLSNQLSYWLTQVDQNLEIDLDIGAMDQEAFNTFQLRLSYSFLNGRLRVTRDGTFGNQTSQSSAANMIGDWTIDYMLTPDGKFKVKMYSRSNFNQLTNTLGTQAAVTTGVSLLHTQSFNSIKDLLRTTRERRRKQLELPPKTSRMIRPCKVFMLLMLCGEIAFAQPDSLQHLYKKRQRTVIIGSSVAYSASMVVLTAAWYSQSDRQSFRFFNDAHEWKQMDKLGHTFSAFQVSAISSATWQWSGVSKQKSDRIGSLISFGIMSSIEVLDGFSAGYGASVSDVVANAAGTGLYWGQQALWNETRIYPKYSFHRTPYAPMRPALLGNGLAEELLKDYNGQTQWLSVDMDKFMSFPKWLNIFQLALVPREWFMPMMKVTLPLVIILIANFL
jgi:uncharacterized protein YfiM (DUF2279 family)